tara:strand:- start:14800 stop:16071 length:1272 start_codon:yes stop_codon:yes gene_type:complete
MERQEISPDLSSREIVQRKIAGALDYLGENLNIVDKSVREGKATNMDIARSFTGDVKSDKLTENIGLLDLTGAGTYFAFEEGEKDILKAEPDNFKRQMALLSALRQPLQTIIDRPDIGLPAFDMMSGVAEAIPATAVMLKPVKNFLLSLKAKATKPSKDVGMNIQKTSLPISGGDSTTTKIAENQVTDPSRRKFVKGVGALGALTTVSPLIGDIPIDKIKLATKSITKIPTTFSNSLKKFTAPLYRNYLDEVIENNKMIGRSGKTEFEDLPITDENAFEENSITANIYEGLFNNQGGALGEFEDLPLEEKAKLVEKNYGVKDGLHIKPNELSDKLVFDASVDFGGDYENEFRSALQNRAIEDGAKPTEILETEPEYAGIMVYQDAKASDNMADVVEEYYEKLIKDGRSPDDIAEQVFEGPFPE